MKKRKLKGFVLPTVYVLIIFVICLTVVLFNKSLNKTNDDLDHAVSSLKDEVIPVISEQNQVLKPINPCQGENVNLTRDYYNKDASEDNQQKSLIYYESTYMENTGILYTSKSEFTILATLDGTVKSIKDNELLGKTIEVTHSNNLSTVYYSLNEVVVKEGSIVKQGDILGKSGTNKIENIEGTALLFEVYYNGKTMDPKTFYETDVNTLE